MIPFDERSQRAAMEEEWRTIAGYPDYAVSNVGRIRRQTDKPGSPAKAGYILRSFPLKDGYFGVTLCGPQGQRQAKIHLIVCRTFHGVRPSNRHEAAHWDGDKSNNREDNLRWALPIENHGDMIRHGRTTRGRRSRRVDGVATDCAKLSADQVLEIRRLIASGSICRVIGAQFGVSEAMIFAIKHRRAWGWL